VDIVSYLHEKRICHRYFFKFLTYRDLTPENIIINLEEEEPKIKLIDFNAAQKFDSSGQMMSRTGFLPYRAPEMFRSEYFYDYKVDYWSLGACLAFLLLKKDLFSGK